METKAEEKRRNKKDAILIAFMLFGLTHTASNASVSSLGDPAL